MVAKVGKEAELEGLLTKGPSIVMDEKETVSWLAFCIDAQTFGIFYTVANDEDRQLHIGEKLPSPLFAKVGELVSVLPSF